jgi:hypothetical protein
VLRLYPHIGLGVVMGNTTRHYDAGAIADADAVALAIAP